MCLVFISLVRFRIFLVLSVRLIFLKFLLVRFFSVSIGVLVVCCGWLLGNFSYNFWLVESDFFCIVGVMVWIMLLVDSLLVLLFKVMVLLCIMLIWLVIWWIFGSLCEIKIIFTLVVSSFCKWLNKCLVFVGVSEVVGLLRIRICELCISLWRIFIIWWLVIFSDFVRLCRLNW